MTFKDLSPWDLDLIKSVAITLFTSTRGVDRFWCLTQSTVSCIHAKGYNITPETAGLVEELVDSISSTITRNSRTPSADEIINEVFEYLRICKFEVVRDEKREPTWSTPKDSWYSDNTQDKKPWQI